MIPLACCQLDVSSIGGNIHLKAKINNIAMMKESDIISYNANRDGHFHGNAFTLTDGMYLGIIDITRPYDDASILKQINDFIKSSLDSTHFKAPRYYYIIGYSIDRSIFENQNTIDDAASITRQLNLIPRIIR